MLCKRPQCDAEEDRIHGYCSCECDRMHAYEEDINQLKEALDLYTEMYINAKNVNLKQQRNIKRFTAEIAILKRENKKLKVDSSQLVSLLAKRK